MRFRSTLSFGSRLPFLALLVLAACSSKSSTTAAAPGADAGATDPGADAGVAAAIGFETYVILGDSISDRGGSGPFFYDLLPKNVDATYPDYAGKDLGTKYPGIKVVKGSVAGATSASLLTQINSLQETLDGPVVVTITIGGNDMSAAAVQILQNQDQPQKDKFSANLTAAYDALMKPGRFGDGVKLKVFQANIYDPSDGEGNFAEAGCPAPFDLFPKKSTVASSDAWNKVMTDTLAKYAPDVVVTDMRARFQGYGIGHFKDGTSWFAPDCIHPNTKGHNEIRKMFWEAITK